MENIFIDNIKQYFENEFVINFRKDLGCLFVDDDEKRYKGIMIYLENNQLINLVSFLGVNYIQDLINNDKYKYGNYTISSSCIDFLFSLNFREHILSQLPISLETEEGLANACTLVKQYMEEVANPFFYYFQDIRDLLPFLETSDNGYIASIFSSHGFIKKMIIWKLCSHPRYKELTDEMLLSYERRLQSSPGDKSLQGRYNLFLKVFKKLEKTKPLYEWDEKYLIAKPFDASPIPLVAKASTEASATQEPLTDQVQELIKSLSLDGTIAYHHWQEPSGWSIHSQVEAKLDWQEDTSKISFKLKGSKANLGFEELKKQLFPLGYYPFFTEMGSRLNDHYEISILKTTDAFQTLRYTNTEAPNYSLEVEAIITKLQQWHQQYGIEIVGSGSDWLCFYIHNLPSNVEQFIKEEIYPFCPDYITQGTFANKPLTEAIASQADVLSYQKIVSLWWD